MQEAKETHQHSGKCKPHNLGVQIHLLIHIHFNPSSFEWICILYVSYEQNSCK